jgi:hypothetical protein
LEFTMKMLSISLPFAAFAVFSGCAMHEPGTTAMGAGPVSTASTERTLYCKDGSYVTKSVGCAAGVERDMTPAAAPATRY